MSLSSIVSQYRKELLQLEQQSERTIRSSHDNMIAIVNQHLSKLYAQLKQLNSIAQLELLHHGNQLKGTKADMRLKENKQEAKPMMSQKQVKQQKAMKKGGY